MVIWNLLLTVACMAKTKCGRLVVKLGARYACHQEELGIGARPGIQALRRTNVFQDTCFLTSQPEQDEAVEFAGDAVSTAKRREQVSELGRMSGFEKTRKRSLRSE